jgi:hypothetical protein
MIQTCSASRQTMTQVPVAPPYDSALSLWARRDSRPYRGLLAFYLFVYERYEPV